MDAYMRVQRKLSAWAMVITGAFVIVDGIHA